MDCFRCRGKDEEDHHSKNLRRKIDVGRIRLRDEASRGKSFVRRKVMGERDKDVFPAISAGIAGGACHEHY